MVLGSAHRLTGDHKPHNSLYIISDTGRLVDRYDKRFCRRRPRQAGDLAHYSPAANPVWDLHGVRCGALICYDYRFPELYRKYKRDGVQLCFIRFMQETPRPHGWPSRGRARAGAGRAEPGCHLQLPGITMPAVMTAEAACNHVWISCPNSSAPESAWPAFMMRADGVTAGRLRRNVAGVLVTDVDTEQELYDSTAAWRDRAMAGQLHSGTLVQDRRSADRTSW